MLAARVFAWAGEGDAAVGLLERLAVAEPGLPAAAVARQPWYTVPLRDHPGFRALGVRLDADGRRETRVAGQPFRVELRTNSDVFAGGAA